VLTEIFREAFMRDDLELSPGTSSADVEGWDSFKQIEIIVAAEERFCIKLSSRELDSLQNVGDLVHAIAARRAVIPAAHA
jgi:acyl carrier protein